MFVNRDDEDSVRPKQSSGKLQAPGHKTEPLAVPPTIIVVNIAIVVLPIASTRVIRRVDVDTVNLASVEKGQELEGMVVFAVDNRMGGTGGGARSEPTKRGQRRVDWVAKPLNHQECGEREDLSFAAVQRFKAGSPVTVQLGHAVKRACTKVVPPLDQRADLNRQA